MAMTGKKLIALIARDKLSVDRSDWTKQTVSFFREAELYERIAKAKLTREQLERGLAFFRTMAEEFILKGKQQLNPNGRVKGHAVRVARSIVRRKELQHHIRVHLDKKPNATNEQLVRALFPDISNWFCFEHSKPWTRATLEHHVKRIAPIVREAKGIVRHEGSLAGKNQA